MREKTRKKCVALLTILAMVICTIFCSNTAKADTKTSWDDSDIAEISTCVVNGVERSLITLKNNCIYLKVGDNEPIYLNYSTVPYKFDKYGTIWSIETNSDIYWTIYNLNNTIQSGSIIIDDDYSIVTNVSSFIFDSEDKFVIGFTLSSNDSYYTLIPDEIHAIIASENNFHPTLRPISSSGNTPTPTPTTPSPSPSAPVASPDNSTPSTIPTSNPSITSPNANSVTPTPAVTKKSVKKKAGYSCLSVGSKVTSKYKLTKGKLTWKGNGKSKKFSGVKSAGFIKKSGNLVFMTKQGKVYTLSSKGKKKCIVKKKAKKLIVKNKFVVKVKVGKKFINLANK